MKKDTFILIGFPKFQSIVAKNLTREEIVSIIKIKNTMVYGEYAGYSPQEQDKRKSIEEIVGDKKIEVVDLAFAAI